MIKVFQQYDDDCLRACVASILEQPIHRVPHFLKEADKLGVYEYKLIGRFAHELGWYGFLSQKIVWTGFHSIMVGMFYLPTRSDVGHAVVAYHGFEVHNPDRNTNRAHYRKIRANHYINFVRTT